MNLFLAAPEVLRALLLLLLLGAAAEDVVRLRISNAFSAAVLAGAVVAALVAGPQWALWQNAVLFVAALVVGTALFARRIMGGGDVKLLAAILAWLDFAAAGRLVVIAAIAGGVWTLVVALVRQLRWSDRARARYPLLRPRGGIAYAVSFAVAGISMLPG